MTTKGSAELLRLINGFQVSQAVGVAAELGIADHLKSGLRDIAGLAAATGSHPRSLHRLMRALCAVGVFQEDADGRFALTPMGAYLRTDVDESRAAWARLVVRDYLWQAWAAALHGVRTGATPFEHVHGHDVWAYREQRPAESALFDLAMASLTKSVACSVMEAVDFGVYDNVVDVGGGRGAFLAQILLSHLDLRATLCEQGHVAREARNFLGNAGLSERCRIVEGDFFKSVPAGGDVYVLKSILHDWDDKQSLAILRACRRAIAPTAKLLVIEHVMDALNPSPDCMDLVMMVVTGGMERTASEYADLFSRAGFELEWVLPTPLPTSILQCRPG